MSRIRPFIPALAWMAVMFAFSTSMFGGDETGTLVDAAVLYFYPSASPYFLHAANFNVRKAAHFAEYAFLAFLWYRGLRGGGRGRYAGHPGALAAAFLICVLYAATDETHQSYVPNRTGSPLDVLLDSSGAASACILLDRRNKKARPPGRAG